ncbi:hypothetical protein [Marinobacter sp. BGYM27]|uniref:hypothetical protein n=1 Tax=Marinobacter sp. BGYM27 TaxID=2975597 RepID=UPI0021A4B2A8|nr:hypothetical protein [Marinobacter sp. BGYM27]MDG5501212.1 hypothetical protein [Marinobacter sp. BGYM27]
MMMDWREMPVFEGVDLNDSFILGWTQDGGRLAFYIEASIWPESKYYSTPKAGEYTCYRSAVLEFVRAIEITGLRPIELTPPSIDPDGSKDYGNIDLLVTSESGFSLAGDFGDVSIRGGELRFDIHA